MFGSTKSSNAVSWLIVFLGNPGAKYAGTRHNCGFMTADIVEKNTGANINKLRFSALTARCTLGGESVLLMKPQTYMNLSGDAVIQAVNFYKIPPEHVLVVSDDISLPAGKLRVRRSGSAGGHNGLKSIIARLGTDAFPRIKIGVGSPDNPDYDMPDWVLGKLNGTDGKLVEDAITRAADALESYIRDGAEKTMSKFN